MVLTDERRALLGDHEAAKRLTDAGVLLPCPWCGETSKVRSFHRKKELFDLTYIECNCGIRTRIFGNLNRAIGCWNTRAPILSAEEMEMLEGIKMEVEMVMKRMEVLNDAD